MEAVSTAHRDPSKTLLHMQQVWHCTERQYGCNL